MKRLYYHQRRILGSITFLLAAAAMVQRSDATQPAQTRRLPAALRPVADVPNLPRVLLIGDSISIGYTPLVRDVLKGKANVHHPPTNCGPTVKGLAQIDQWLGAKRWDVIHFNWGLHDLKYVGADGVNRVDPRAAGSHQMVPIKQYEKNLRRLVARLQRTGAKLIWCATTPVPAGAQGRIVGDAVRYNAVAEKIMRERAIPIDDLYALAKPRLGEIQRRANVHFTKQGYRVLAKQVANSIMAQLRKEHLKW